jgi:hypothetical protein
LDGTDPDFKLPYWAWTENPDPSKPFAPRVHLAGAGFPTQRRAQRTKQAEGISN